jgi:hypothetical protein
MTRLARLVCAVALACLASSNGPFGLIAELEY